MNLRQDSFSWVQESVYFQPRDFFVVEDWALDEVWTDSDAKEAAAINEVVAIVDVAVLDEAVSLVLDEA